jgi:phosphoadenosine phosphosulfate reductase
LPASPHGYTRAALTKLSRLSRVQSGIGPPLADENVRALNERFEAAGPLDVLQWVLAEPALPRVAVASSFQAEGTCIMDMATDIRPDVPILFLETGFHFAETLAFKEQLTERLCLNVIDLVGDYTVERQAAEFGERLYERDPAACCELNKVAPFTKALHHFDAWITALRRDSSPTRAETPIIEQYELEPGKWMVKANPIANWTRRDVWAYMKERNLPHNPLYDLGYASVGCAPCTRTLFAGENERAGRWDGSQKVECGIHKQETQRQEALAAPAD